MKQYQEQVEHIAFHDALTHLPNRLLLADRMTQAFAPSYHHRDPGSGEESSTSTASSPSMTVTGTTWATRSSRSPAAACWNRCGATTRRPASGRRVCAGAHLPGEDVAAGGRRFTPATAPPASSCCVRQTRPMYADKGHVWAERSFL